MSEDIFDKIRDKDYTPYCEEARRQMESYRPEQVQLETVKHQAHDAFSFVGPEGKNDREGIAYKTSSGFMKVENVPPCETNVCGPLSKKGSQN